jgi:hypothetical protein
VTATEDTQKLPLWRLIAALFVLGSLVVVLLALAPVYIDNYRLQRSLREMTQSPASDETLQRQVLDRARSLDLPITRDEIEIAHQDGKTHVEIKYAVQMILPLYRVDLHFHPAATSP